MAAPRLMDGKLNSKMETLLLEVQIDQKKKQAAGMESDIKALEAMIQNKKTSFEGLQERLTAMRSVLNKVQNIEPEVGLEDYVANIMEQISLCKTAETEWSESFDSGMSSLQDNVKKWSEQKTKLESDNEALGAECWSLKEALVVGEQRRQRIDSEQAMVRVSYSVASCVAVCRRVCRRVYVCICVCVCMLCVAVERIPLPTL
eukprot:m.330012 g.330012  ORF g.330012 m.330012 type:complete len:203 (+) comp20455_c0_seq6:363-971(+)